MHRCEHIGECAFYNDKIVDMKEAGHLIKNFYCLEHPEKCRRLESRAGRNVSDESYHMSPWGTPLM